MMVALASIQSSKIRGKQKSWNQQKEDKFTRSRLNRNEVTIEEVEDEAVTDNADNSVNETENTGKRYNTRGQACIRKLLEQNEKEVADNSGSVTNGEKTGGNETNQQNEPVHEDDEDKEEILICSTNQNVKIDTGDIIYPHQDRYSDIKFHN